MDKTRTRIGLWLAVGALMALPVAAERGLRGVAWDPGDAVFLGILAAGVAVAGELAARTPARRSYAAGVGIALGAGLFQAWINLAVGIIGSEDHPANLIYAGVIAVAAAGAVIARCRPAGLARAMSAAAAAQLVAFAVALASGLGFTGPITIFFTALWLIAGWSFRRAADADSTQSAPFPMETMQ